jgi:molybdopterin-containing oxidoreductase family iron-sulfur binding subunit
VHKQWRAQQVDLDKHEQVKDQEEGGSDLRGYRIYEWLAPYPSIMYLERVRESEI